MPQGSNASKGVKGFHKTAPTPPSPAPKPPAAPAVRHTSNHTPQSPPDPAPAAPTNPFDDEVLSDEELHLWWLLQHGHVEPPQVQSGATAVQGSGTQTIRIAPPSNLDEVKTYLRKVKKFAHDTQLDTNQLNILLLAVHENSPTQYRAEEDGSFTVTSASGQEVTYANDADMSSTVIYNINLSATRNMRHGRSGRRGEDKKNKQDATVSPGRKPPTRPDPARAAPHPRPEEDSGHAGSSPVTKDEVASGGGKRDRKNRRFPGFRRRRG